MKQYIHPYNYCLWCGKALAKKSSISCTGYCYSKVEKVRTVVRDRLRYEKAGYKTSSHQVSKEFSDLQYFLNK